MRMEVVTSFHSYQCVFALRNIASNWDLTDKISLLFQSYKEGVQNTRLKIRLIHCLSVCTKCGEIDGVVGEVGFKALATETWLTGGTSYQKTVGDVSLIPSCRSYS